MLGILFFLTISFKVDAQKNNHTDDETKEVIVKFRANLLQSKKREITEKTKAVVLKRFENTDTELWRIPLIVKINGQTYKGLNTITDYVKSHPGIQYIEPNHSINIFHEPDDPSFDKLWGLQNTGQLAGLAGADIGALDAWEMTTGTNAIIGVLDTGIDWTHEDLVDNIWQNLGEDADGDGHVLEWSGGQWIFDPGDENGIDDDGNGKIDDLIGWDFANDDNNPYDDHSHGTHVSGIIAAKGNNGIGLTGVAWQARIMPLKIFDVTGNGDVFSAQEALAYALQMGANVTNVSWGTTENSQTLEDAFASTQNNNDHIVVAAAGNNGRDNDILAVYPASYDFQNIISVAATDRHNSLTLFSNYGENSVDIGAPGGEIYSTLPGNLYGWYSGTSMSTPYVAGAVALAFGICNNPTIPQLKDNLLNTTTPLTSMEGKARAGNLHVGRFLTNVSRPNANFDYVTNGLEVNFVVSHNRTGATYHWEYGDDETDDLTGAEVTYTFGQSGHYVVCLTVSDDCGANTSCQDIFVNTNNVVPNCDPEWQQLTYGNHVLALTVQGDYVWAGTTGGLAKVHRTDHSSIFYTNSNSGLPHNHINAVAVDANGVKWIGTPAGLTKFDGTNWTTFDTQNSGLPSDDVQSVAISQTGEVWTATKGAGIAHFNGNNNWVTLNSSNSALPDDNVKKIIFDNNGELYAATYTAGVAKLSATLDSFTSWNAGNSNIPDNAINDITLNPANGNIWIVTQGGIAKYNGNIWQQVSSMGITNPILSIGISPSGSQWLGTMSDIYTFNDVVWQPSALLSDGPESVNTILVVDNDERWFGTDRSLTKDVNNQSVVIPPLNSPLPGNVINAFAEDNNNNMWIGTNKGLVRFTDGEWAQDGDFQDIEIRALYYEEDGKLWVGTNSDILEVDIDNEDLPYTTHTPFNDAVTTITADNNGKIWIGTAGSGVAVYDNAWTTYTASSSNLPNNTIHSILHDSNVGEMWIATGGGIANLTSNNYWTVYNTNSVITDVKMGSDGVKWLTTPNSLAYFTGATWVNQSITDAPKNIESVLIDDNNDKWLATGEGLCKFDGYVCTIYNVANSPVPNDKIQTISRDAKGSYWVGTHGGVGILSALTASFNFDQQSICTSTVIPFRNSSSNTDAQDWYIDDVYVSSNADYTHDFQNFGTYQVKLVTKSSANCTATFTKEVNIGGRADDLDLEEQFNVCDVIAELDASIEGMQTYLWYKDGVMLSDESRFVAQESGDYILRVQDWCDNWATDTLSVTVSDNCVWAGDTNNDGVVDARDVLSVGQFQGETGPTRQLTATWSGQAAPTWQETEWAYADANGDGAIDSLDLDIIDQYYYQTHGEAGMGLNTLMTNGTNPYGQILGIPPVAYVCIELDESSLFNNHPDVVFDIVLTKENNIPVLESYGLSYTFKHTGTMQSVDFSNAWLIGSGSFDDLLTFTQVDPGKTDIAVSRQDQNNLIGDGSISQIVILEDLPTGNAVNLEHVFIYSIENINLEDKDGNIIPAEGHTLVISHAGPGTNMAFSVKGLAETCHRNGEASVTVHGGTAPFTYQWDNGETTPNISNLSAGLHYITVTDATGTELSAMAYIEDNTGVYLDIDVTSETAFNTNGSITVNASGSSNFTYQWSTGQTSPTIAGLEAGTYTVTVTNDEGCQKIEEIKIAGTVCVSPKLILEGAYDKTIGRMRTSLRDLQLLPLISPYSTGESVSITAFDAPNAGDVIVDWIIVELRSDIDRTRVAQQTAFIQSDGDVVSLDGTVIKFVDVEQGNYHLTLRHRNHLTTVSEALSFGRTPVVKDFTQSANTWNSLYPPLRQVASDKYATLGGSAPDIILNKQEDINGEDIAKWGTKNGNFGFYIVEDFTLDGDINGGDKVIWSFNNGNFLSLPD